MASGPGLKLTVEMLTSSDEAGFGESVDDVGLNGATCGPDEEGDVFGGGIGADEEVAVEWTLPLTTTVGGGVASRTDPGGRAGTCKEIVGFAGRFVGGWGTKTGVWV
jgi:hypothetical protein